MSRTLQQLWEEHLAVPVPREAQTEVDGTDLLFLDSVASGILSTAASQTALQEDQEEALTAALEMLEKVAPKLSGDVAAYFGRLHEGLRLVDGSRKPGMPQQVVQRQLEAYNARDVEAWLATYAPDAQQFELHGGRLASGHAEMRARINARFAEPDLHATLLQRAVMGNLVVDLERITRNFPEGKGTLEMLCIYEVAGETIRKATFATGAKTLFETPA